jgi:hypothetical protein
MYTGSAITITPSSSTRCDSSCSSGRRSTIQ